MSTGALKYPEWKEPAPAVLEKVQSLAGEYEGKIAAIEPESGEFFIGETVMEAAKEGRRKFPHATFYFVRIGYEAVDFQCGGLLKA